MMNAAILGCGTIGSGVYEVIERNQKEIREACGQEIRVKRILDLRQFPGQPFEKLVTPDIKDIVEDPEIDIVVETMGGTKPAYEFVKSCLLAGKHVTTSNKALVAAHGTDLLETARKMHRNFFFEASVGGGIPLIRTLYTGYAGQEIEEITGILNGTTNYILTKMSREGSEFADVLKEAQQLGYAERNPEADVEGYDTCRKIAILASLVTDREIDYQKIHTEGITKIEPVDFRYAESLHASIRLVGSMVRARDGISLLVAPELIPEESPLCGVSDVFNGVLIRGNTLGVTMLYGAGAGKLPTASAVVADIIEIAKHREENVPFGWHEGALSPMPLEKRKGRFFVRVSGSGRESEGMASAALGGAKILHLDGEKEFGLLTGEMTEEAYAEAAARVPGIVKMIRAAV